MKLFLFSSKITSIPTIIVADTKKEAFEMLKNYNPTLSYVGIINKSLLDNLKLYNKQVLNNASKGEEIKEKIKYYIYNGYTKEQITCLKTSKPLTNPNEENKYIYIGKDDEGHHLCCFTGSWKCKKHINKAEVWFYLPEEA